MDLELTRADYCIVGTTLRSSMRLLPGATGYRQPQQVVVGDQDGVLQVFSIKKEDIQIQFKTLPTDRITMVQIAGASGPGMAADKIFVAMDNKVKAFTRKGKLFLSFDINMTETIKSMFVFGNELIVCGNHMYNHYRELKDVGNYLCGDTIVDVIALCPNNTNRIITVLACSGRVLRLLEHCRVRQTIELDSVPTVLHVPAGRRNHGDRFLCGYADGKVTLVKVNQYGLEVTEEVLVKSNESTSAVTAMDTFDMSGDGNDDLLVGRRDGTVQVFNIPDNIDDTAADIDTEVRQFYCDNFHESISSIQGGCVAAAGYTEIVVCTYTGRIFGLTTQCIKLSLSDSANNTATSLSMDTKARLSKLRNEIEDLEHKVTRERERYQISTQCMSDGISAIPMLPVNDSMILSKDDASYMLSIEIPAPIEFVLLQSDVPVKILDVDKNTAVVSFSACAPMSGNQLLATYRCQVDTNRVDLKLRTIEGHHGTLCAYITPALPPKVSQIRRYCIRPLSMHIRVHSFDDSRPHNELSLKGPFSHAEIHTWIAYCLPEVPDKVTDEILFFRNVFAGTFIRCEYGKGYATFKSDNVTTISILKDVLTKNATRKRIKLEIATNINGTSLSHMVKLIEPELLKCVRCKADHELLEALLDLDIRTEAEFECLCPEFRDVLQRKTHIADTFPHNMTVLDRIYGLLTDSFIDLYRLKGSDVQAKVPNLLRLLENDYDYNKVLEFLNDDGSSTANDRKDYNHDLNDEMLPVD